MKRLSMLLFALSVILFYGSLSLFAQETGDGPAAAAEGGGISGYCRTLSAQDLLSGPGTNFKKVRSLDAGHLLRIIGEKGDYFRVEVPDGFTCYIHVDFLQVGSESKGQVKGNRVNLRSIPRIEGDYPIYKVDMDRELMVWDRVGEWYCVTAPEDAFLYVLKSGVNRVEGSPEIEAELRALAEQRIREWEAHGAVIKKRIEAEQKSDLLKQKLDQLENSADTAMARDEMEEALDHLQKLADSTEDETAKKLALTRVREVQAVLDKREAEASLREREDAWRRERDDLMNELNTKESKSLKPMPSTHDSKGRGRVVNVLGIVDAQGGEVLLKGGRTQLDTLYRVECPDGRYTLPDFQGKRVSVLGRIEDVAVRDELPLVVVERITLL